MAEPISLAIASAITAAGVGGAATATSTILGVTFAYSATALTISQVVTAGLFIGGSLLASALLAPNPPDVPRPEAAKETFEVSDAPRLIVLGRARVSGNIVFKVAKDNVLYIVIAHAQGELDAVEEVYLGGRTMTVDPDGSVSSPPYGRIGGADWISVFTKLGTEAEQAWDLLVSEFPDAWTVQHRGLGVAQSLLVCRSPGITDMEHTKIYPQGAPQLELLVRGPKWFDPRVGGHTWSDNGVLGILHLLTSPERDGGWGLPIDLFDLDDIALEADKADAPVALKAGGSEPRSRISGAYTTELSRGDLLANALLSTGTQILPTTDGRWTIRLIDDNPRATITINLPDTTTVAWTAGPESIERPNRCRVTYYSPERQWSSGDIPLQNVSWANYPDEAEDVGERVETIDLPFCPSHAQAARIARRIFALRRAPRGEVTTNLRGLRAMGHAHALIPIPDLGILVDADLSGPRFLEDGISMAVPFVERPVLDEWIPLVHEPDAPDVLPEIADGDAPTPPIIIAVVTVPASGGSELRIAFDAEEPPGAAEAVYRPAGGVFTAMSESISGTRVYGYSAIALGTTVTVRGRVAVSATESPSDWSEQPTLVAAYADFVPSAPTAGRSTVGGTNTQITASTTQIEAAEVRVERDTGSGFVQVAQTWIGPWAPYSQTFAGTTGTFRVTLLGPAGSAGPSVVL